MFEVFSPKIVTFLKTKNKMKKSENVKNVLKCENMIKNVEN